MSMYISVESEGDRPVVVKRGGAAAAPRLRAEGERLRRASHPGVVEVLRSAPAEGGWELRMAHGGRPLDAVGEVPLSQAAALVASLASTVADLHELGVVHGRIDGTHVLVGDHGRPRLCGFGDGTVAAAPEDDVAALGALLTELVGGGDDAEPIPEHRWRLPRRRWAGWERRGLLLLADQACAEPPTRRPTARRLAAAVAAAAPATPATRVEAAAPEARSADGAEIDAMASLRATALVGSTERRAGPPAVAVGALGLGLLVAGVLRMAPSSSGTRTEPPAAPQMAPPATADAPPEPVEAERQAIPLPEGELTVDGVRYRIGEAGDEVLIADWDCDGSPTPALLRPSTGEVFVFPRWIGQGRLEVAAILRVEHAEQLVSATPPGGCPTLAVRTSTGARVPVIESPT